MRPVYSNTHLSNCQILFDSFFRFCYTFFKISFEFGDLMKKLTICIVLIALLLTGCSVSEPEEADLYAMDTLMKIKIWGEHEDLILVTDEIHRLDLLLSAADSGSLLSQINLSGSAELSGDILTLTQDALSLSEKTGGAFDPTVYPLVRLWGFPDDAYHVPTQEELDETLPLVGTEHIHMDGSSITLDKGTMLDFGAIAKGYAAQQCVNLLEENGVEAALLSLGGNVQTLGTKPDETAWNIGIADPDNPSQAIAQLSFFGSKALVTSGGYQRFFEFNGVSYHHILDPKSGMPADNSLASVTILCDNGEVADAYSTALFVMGLEEATEFWKTQNDFDAVFILKDRTIYATEGCAELLSGCEFTVIKR